MNAPAGPLGDEHLGAVGLLESPLAPDGQDVLLDGQLDGVGAGAGQVEVDEEGVALAVGIHRHRCRPGGSSEHLLGEPVEFAERIGADKHDRSLLTSGRPVWARCPQMYITDTRII